MSSTGRGQKQHLKMSLHQLGQLQIKTLIREVPSTQLPHHKKEKKKRMEI